MGRRCYMIWGLGREIRGNLAVPQPAFFPSIIVIGRKYSHRNKTSLRQRA